MKKKDCSGHNNPNWRGGVSKKADGTPNYYRYKELQRMRHPEMIRAHKRVAYAVKVGKLVRKPCEVCGDPKVQAHHEDYAYPLDVQWYCQKHHREKDEERRARNAAHQGHNAKDGVEPEQGSSVDPCKQTPSSEH